MASGPITSWQMRKKWKAWQILFFLSSKITVHSDSSHEIKRHLLFGRKAMTNWDSILKRRDITWLTKFCTCKAMVFPAVTCGCESWTIKKAECQRVDAFELWGWRRLFRDLWTARKSNQSIQKEINPEYSMNVPMLKLQYFGHLIKSLLIGKDPESGKDRGQEEKWATEDEMVGWHHWLNGDDFGQISGDSEGQGKLICCSSWVANNQTRLGRWATITTTCNSAICLISNINSANK